MQILYYFPVAIAIFVIVITDIEVGKELNFGKENDIQKAKDYTWCICNLILNEIWRSQNSKYFPTKAKAPLKYQVMLQIYYRNRPTLAVSRMKF